MRKAPLALIAAAALVLLAACDSDQPASLGTSTATLSFATAAAPLPVYDCYEVWTDTLMPDPDNPGGFIYDGVPDQRADPPSVCFDTGEIQTATFPYRHATTVLVLRAGRTDPEVVASSAVGGNQYGDVTPFDTTPTQPAPDRPPENVGSSSNRYYLYGKRANVGTFTYLSLRETTLVDGVDIKTETVVPNLFDPQPAQTDPYQQVTAAETFEFDLNPGDTVSVSSRKAPLGLLVSPLYPPAVLEATLAVDGVPVAVRGIPDTTADEQTSLSFSYSRN